MSRRDAGRPANQHQVQPGAVGLMQFGGFGLKARKSFTRAQRESKAASIAAGHCPMGVGVRINSNIPALNAQRNLSQTTRALSRALARLSSGQRVTSARDDAAGLAIGEGLNSQVRGLRQIALNINQAFGYLNTAEGIISTQIDLVQRMKELAVQAASGTISSNDRNMLDEELQSLLAEFERIAEDSTFNGTHLLNGSLGTISLQVGLHKGQTIDFSLPDSRGSAIFTNASTVGTGRFEESLELSLEDGPYIFQESGDFDDDGDIDFIVYGFNTSEYWLYKQDENGNFAAEATDGNGNYADYGDINGDGKIDRLVWEATNVVVQLQDQDGNFVDSQVLSTTSAYLRDFDSDGDLDVVRDGSSSPRVAINDGSGNLSLSATFAFGASNAEVTQDINGDGILDAVAIEGISNRVIYALGSADGSFTVLQTLNLGAGYTSIKFGDFTGDGIQDVVGLHSTNGNAVIQIGSSSGSFSAGAAQTSGLNYSSLLEAQDINGDGFDDLFFVNDATDSVAIKLSNGAGGFTTGTTYSLRAGSFDAATLANDHFADLDDDGSIDLVTHNGSSASIYWGNGEGGFSQGATLGFTNPYGLQLEDITGDGLVDFVTTEDSFSISIIPAEYAINQGGRTFSAGNIDTTRSFVMNTDLNGDGVNDFIMSEDPTSLETDFSIYLQETMLIEEAASIEMRTQEQAQDLLDVFDRALTKLSQRRAQIGATQSRLESALTTTSIAMENLSAARSQILDLEIASEIADLARLQILQQAQVSVLAQSNVNLGLALNLLRGIG